MLGRTNAVIGKGGGGGSFVSWSSGSWEDITAMIMKHYNGEIEISDYWAVGDSRQEVMADGTTDTLTIIDFNHDDLFIPIGSRTKSAITIMRTQVFDGGFVSYQNNYYGGFNFATFKSMIPTITAQLSQLLKTVNVKIVCADTNSTQTFYENTMFFPPSYRELTGENVNTIVDEGEQYEYFKVASNRVLSDMYYTRSVYVNKRSNVTVTSSGGFVYYCNANSTGEILTNSSKTFTYLFQLNPKFMCLMCI